MSIPVQISYRETLPSPALEHAIHERIDRLAGSGERIRGCHVVVETAGIHITLDVLGEKIVISRRNGTSGAHVAVREAFDAARRQLDTRKASA